MITQEGRSFDWRALDQGGSIMTGKSQLPAVQDQGTVMLVHVVRGT